MKADPEVDSPEAKPDNETEDSSPKKASRAGKAIASTRDKLKEEGEGIKERARESAKSRADNLVDSTSSHVRNLEEVARTARQQLDDNQPEYLKIGMDIVADKVADVADYFELNDSEKVTADAKQFVREHPGVVLGGLVLAGFLAGRFVKATEPDGELEDS